MKIHFVTKNTFKYKSFTTEFVLEGLEIEQLPVDTVEIQAENNYEIAEFSAKWAADKHNVIVLKEDIGLYIEALNGFPGPYLNYVENILKTEGYLKLMHNIENRKAYWEYAIAYCEPGKTPVSFFTHQYGEISKVPKGDTDYYIPKLFIPDGQDKTISELINLNEYKRNIQHYKQLKQFLAKTISNRD